MEIQIEDKTIVIKKKTSGRASFKIMDADKKTIFCAWCRQRWFENEEAAIEAAKKFLSDPIYKKNLLIYETPNKRGHRFLSSGLL